MRLARVGLIVLFLLLVIPAWAQQTSQSGAPPASDPQAIAVVQAAITALGGATAISQAQSWTFQAQMQGPYANGEVDYVISSHTDTGKIMHNDGTTTRARPIHSHLVPALVGAILLKESRDPEFSIQYGGTLTEDSKPVTKIIFAVESAQIPAQVWFFDAANLPIRIDFRLPAEIGARESFPIVVALSEYRSVFGVSYPFQIASFLPGKPPEIVTLHSVNADGTTPPNEYNGAAGDLR
jgi:hypothetical protein